MIWQGVVGTEKFKLIKFLSSRLSVTLILIIVQAAWLALMFLKLVGYSDIISDGFKVLSIAMALYIITKADVPAYRMGWIPPVSFFVPLLYVLPSPSVLHFVFRLLPHTCPAFAACQHEPPCSDNLFSCA